MANVNTDCLAVGPHGFMCTREDEHSGKYHVAHSDEMRNGRRVVLDRWLIEQDEEWYEPSYVQ